MWNDGVAIVGLRKFGRSNGQRDAFAQRLHAYMRLGLDGVRAKS